MSKAPLAARTVWMPALVATLALICAPAALSARPSRPIRPVPPRPAPATYAPVNTINVTGSGEATATPDVAVVRLGVETQAPTAAEAADENARQANAIIAAVRGEGIPANKIQTSWFNVMPVYAPEPPQPAGTEPPKPPRVVAYRVTNVVTVRVERDMARVGPVLDAALKAGANRVEGLSFDLINDEPVRQQALRRAAGEAQRKAAVLADAMGVRLGPPRVISEQGSYQPPMMDMGAVRYAMAAGAPTPVSPGEVRASANVTVQYSFRPR